MNDTLPRLPRRALVWTDGALDVFEHLADVDQPIYVVGGAVRDALLGRPIKDLDLTLPGSGLTLARLIANRMSGAYYPLDPERDVGRVLIETPDGKLVIDVSRFRGDDLLDDLIDRDFTINAMAVDVRAGPGMLIDPTGGEQDIIDRVLRRCNSQAIARDPVRSLRAVRLSVQLRLRIEAATLADCREQGARLVETSPERVRDELFRLLSLPKAATALRIAESLGLLGVVLPEVRALQERRRWQHTLRHVERLTEVIATIGPRRTDETAARFSLGMLVMGLDRYRRQLQQHLDSDWPDERTHPALLILAVLLLQATDAAGAENRALAMPLSNKERERLSHIISHYDAYRDPEDLSPLGLHRFWRVMAEAGIDVCLIALADVLASSGVEIDQNGWIARIGRARTLLGSYFEEYERVVQPPQLVDGRQLMNALDLKPGPIIGRLLDSIREAQVTGAVTTEEDAMELARQLVQGGFDPAISPP